jgi:type IV pilus assembly protein PilY1
VTDGYWNDYDVPLSLPNLGNVDNTSVTTGIAPNGYKYTKTRPYLDANSNTLADVAMYFWNRDLRSDVDNKVLPTADNPAYWQHMVNYTVGFGVTGTLNPATDLPDLASGVKAWGTDKIDDLWHAAVNSRGQYFSANNAGELAAAIRSSLNDAVERDLREAGVAAAATVLEDGNRKYIPKYRTGVWSGDVEAYQLDAKGQAGAKVWSASARLPAWDSRKIFTWDPTRVVGTTVTPAGVPFDWAGLSTPSQTLMPTEYEAGELHSRRPQFGGRGLPRLPQA